MPLIGHSSWCPDYEYSGRNGCEWRRANLKGGVCCGPRITNLATMG